MRSTPLLAVSLFVFGLFTLSFIGCDEKEKCDCRILPDGTLNFHAYEQNRKLIVEVVYKGQITAFVKNVGESSWKFLSTAEPLYERSDLNKSLMQCKELYEWNKEGWTDNFSEQQEEMVIEKKLDSLKAKWGKYGYYRSFTIDTLRINDGVPVQ